MINPWKKTSPSEDKDENSNLTWDQTALQALQQAISQSPVPKVLRGKLKKELSKAAEEQALSAGRTEVTAEDLMHGMLAKMPAAMRNKVEQAMEQGPDGLEKLKKDLGQ